MKLLVDMNLSPAWVNVLREAGIAATHWSGIGKPTAPDREIMSWAREHQHVVFTNDLDFGTLLALTHANGPSVLQVRTQDVTPEALAPRLIALLRQVDAELTRGALIVLDESTSRIRVLPI